MWGLLQSLYELGEPIPLGCLLYSDKRAECSQQDAFVQQAGMWTALQVDFSRCPPHHCQKNTCTLVPIFNVVTAFEYFFFDI